MPLWEAGAKWKRGTAFRHVLINVGIDPTGMKVGIEEAARRWDQYINKVQSSSEKTNVVLKKTFGTRRRSTALSSLSMEASYLSQNLVGLDSRSRLVSAGFSTMQSAALAFGATIPYVIGGGIVLTGVLGAIYAANVKSSEAFSKYRKEMKETAKEQKRLAEDIKTHEEGSGRYNKVLFALIGSMFGWAKAAEYAASKTSKWHEQMGPFLEERDREIDLIRLQTQMLKGETIPQMKAMVHWYQEELIHLRGLGAEEIEEIDRLKQIKSATADLIEWREKLTKAEEEYNKSFRGRDVGLIGEVPEFSKMRQFVFKGKEFFDLKESSDEWRRNMRIMERETQRFQASVLGQVQQISRAFTNTMMGIETDWGSLLANMISQLIASGITAMFMNFLFPGAGGTAGWFKRITGFQHGTPYVPATGMYWMHEGERVIPAEQNVQNIRNYNEGGTVQNFYLLNLDPEVLTKRHIVPIIERLGRDRKTRIMTV